MATEALKLIVGTGEPLLGRVAVLDALSARWREIPLRRAPGRVVAAARADAGAGVSALESDGASAFGHHGARPAGDGARGASASGAEPASVEPAELAALLDAGAPPLLIDVREVAEHAVGGIPGSRVVPLATLRTGEGLAELPEGVPLALFCSVGVRSAEAARLLRAAGRPDVVHLAGGYAAWRLYLAQGRPDAASTPPAVVSAARRADPPHGRERVLP